MTAAFVYMAVLVALLGALVVGQWLVARERYRHLAEVLHQRDLDRQEIQVLTDTIARAGRLTVRRERSSPLASTETWFEGESRIEKITPS